MRKVLSLLVLLVGVSLGAVAPDSLWVSDPLDPSSTTGLFTQKMAVTSDGGYFLVGRSLLNGQYQGSITYRKYDVNKVLVYEDSIGTGTTVSDLLVYGTQMVVTGWSATGSDYRSFVAVINQADGSISILQQDFWQDSPLPSDPSPLWGGWTSQNHKFLDASILGSNLHVLDQWNFPDDGCCGALRHDTLMAFLRFDLGTGTLKRVLYQGKLNADTCIVPYSFSAVTDSSYVYAARQVISSGIYGDTRVGYAVGSYAIGPISKTYEIPDVWVRSMGSVVPVANGCFLQAGNVPVVAFNNTSMVFFTGLSSSQVLATITPPGAATFWFNLYADSYGYILGGYGGNICRLGFSGEVLWSRNSLNSIIYATKYDGELVGIDYGSELVMIIGFDREGIAGMTPDTLTFTAGHGAATPSARSVSITNTNIGIFGALSAAVTYGPGATGWLSVAMSGSGNAQTAQVSITTTTMDTGSYDAVVSLSGDGLRRAVPTQFYVHLRIDQVTHVIDGSVPIRLSRGHEITACNLSGRVWHGNVVSLNHLSRVVPLRGVWVVKVDNMVTRVVVQ